MALQHSFEMDASLDEVFGWHERRGAFERLNPGWTGMKLTREADSLKDGTATLRLPGGVPWQAVHQAVGYRPPHQFVDALRTPGLRSLVPWRHTHRFEDAGKHRTRVVDEVSTPVPGRVLAPVFAYREAQLRADFATHRAMGELHDTPLTVAVTGSSGLVGSALTALLRTGGHRVIQLVRRSATAPDERRWDTDHPASDLLDGVDAVVHLAGASIAGRFTDQHRRAIRDSRVGPTRALAKQAGERPFICASAVGYYGYDAGDEPLTETAPHGAGFLAGVVRDWEDAAHDAQGRVVTVRTGLVLSSKGGLLALQWPLFAAGLGGPLGDGTQWMSWIGLDDLIDVYYRAVADARLTGPVNAVTASPVTGNDFARALGRVLHRPAVLRVSSGAPRLLLGETGARELALASQRLHPATLGSVRHEFRFPALEPLLRHELGKNRT